MYPNDGVMFIFSGNAKPWNHAIVQNDGDLIALDLYPGKLWMPPLGRKWHLCLGRYKNKRQVAIALRRPREHPADDGPWEKPFASGRWSEMWPLYLTYCELLNGS
jgi:hypothetical protein